MANTYFKFKQFIVFHDKCAMKVGTDGVLLGAWTDVSKVNRILDVGTGTGLIALMLAQRNHLASIHAIDIASEAIEQAKDNIVNSPYANRITAQLIRLQDLEIQATMKYDLIVSNPPFFIQSLKSPQVSRTLARHTDSLLVEELVALSSKLLTEQGRLSIIYPYEHKDMVVEFASKYKLFLTRVTPVFPTPTSTAKRILLEFSLIARSVEETSLIIEESRHCYTLEFKQLVKDFYLKL